MLTQPPLVPRAHDLPPLWDGDPIEWGEWEMPMSAVFICPPLKSFRPDCCPKCGCTDERPTARGAVRVAPIDPRSGLRKLRAGRIVLNLLALRCPDCRHDQVTDLYGSRVWDLDESDYTNEGSW